MTTSNQRLGTNHGPDGSGRDSERLFGPQAVLVLLALLSAFGSFVIWYGTFWGPWAFSDGVGYLANARNLLLGRGLGIYRASGDFILLVTHPPLYPWLLAGLGKTGLDLVMAARLIDIVLFGGFLFVSGWGMWRVSRSAWPALGLTAVLLLHPAILLAYLSAMSEPLFLFCIMASLMTMADYISTNRRSRLLISAAAAAGALLTRYPGAALIIACVAGLWLLSDGDWRQKTRNILTYLAISIPPTLAFVVYARFALGARNPRGIKSSLDVPALVVNFAKRALDAVWNWKPVPPDVIPNQLFPTTITRPLAAFLAAILAISLAWAILSAVQARRRMDSSSRPSLEWRPSALFGLFLLSYLGFFGVAYLATSPTPDVDARTLLPLLPAGLLLAFGLASLLLRSAPRTRVLNALLAITIIASLSGWTIISQDIVLGLHRTGLGYTSRAWRESETMRAVANLPPDLALVSNETAAILLYTDRSAYEVPGLKAGDSHPLSLPFGSGSSDLDRAYRQGTAALVLFDTVKDQLGSRTGGEQDVTVGDLTAGLRTVFEGNDGAIYCRCALLSTISSPSPAP